MDVPDPEGEELPDLEAARARARELACFEISEMVKEQGRIVLRHRIDIEDDQRRVVDTIWFRDVIRLES
jgi:hypothetical protein